MKLLLATFIRPLPVLLFLLVFTGAYFFLAHEGFYQNDEFFYAKYAWQYLQGNFSATHGGDLTLATPQKQRFTVILPIALFFQLFGINIYTATLWPLLCSLGSLVFIYLLFRKEEPRVAVTALVLLGLYFYFQFFAGFLYPDNISMFFSLASAGFLYYYRYQTSFSKPFLYAAGFVVFTFFSYIAKESILYYVPFYVYVFFVDLAGKKHRLFWGYTVGLAIILLGLYFSYYYNATGDWLFRFKVYEQSNFDAKSTNFFYATPAEIWERLTYEPMVFFTGTGLIIPFVLVLGLLGNFKTREAFLLKTKSYFWFGLMVMALLQFWFGSTAFSFYTPVPMRVRFLTILLPAICIAAAFAMEHFWHNNRRTALLIAVGFTLICLLHRSSLLIVYLPLCLLFWVCWYQLRKAEFRVPFPVVMAILILLLSLRPVYFMAKPTATAFLEQDEIIKNYLNKPAGKHLVLTDNWLLEFYDFHYQFRPNNNYTFRHFSTPENRQQYEKVYVLINQATMQNPDLKNAQELSYEALDTVFRNRKQVVENGPVKLYELTE